MWALVAISHCESHLSSEDTALCLCEEGGHTTPSPGYMSLLEALTDEWDSERKAHVELAAFAA